MNLLQQELHVDKMRARIEEVTGHTKQTAKGNPQLEDLFEEIDLICAGSHVKKFRAKTLDRGEKLMCSVKSDHDSAPIMIDNNVDLKLRILSKSSEFGIYGDIELD